MPVFVQSAFLQALGYAIANSLWQVALTWLVFMLINTVFRLSAANKYKLAVAAQFIGFIWFAVTLQFYYSQPVYSLAITTASQQATSGFSAQLINLLVKAESVLPYLSIAYLLLMCFLAARWMMGYRHTQLIRNDGLQKMPVDWRIFIKKIASQLNIKREIRLFLSEHVSTPLTIGFLKPVILLPVASINHLTTAQLEAVLLHELAHIKRYDYLLNMIVSVMELALFFNPFTQLLSSTIQKERENCCDDWVLQFQYNASEYAEALLRIAYLQQAPAFAMAAAGKKNELLTRIKRMIGQQENRFNYRRKLLAFILVTGILCSFAWLSPAVSSPASPVIAVAGKKVALPQYLPEQPTITTPAEETTNDATGNILFNPSVLLSDEVRSAIKKNMAISRKELNEASEQLPDIISGALKEAQTAIVEEASAEQDEPQLPKKISSRVENEIKASFKKIKPELEKAKSEVAEKLTKVLFDEDNINQQINTAMDEIKKLNLEQIISDALRFSDLGDDEKKDLINLKNLKFSEKEKDFLLKVIKEKQKKRLRKQPPEQAIHSEAVIVTPAIAPIAIDAPAISVAVVEIPRVFLADEEQVQSLRVKIAVLQRLSKLFEMKVVPVIFKENVKEVAPAIVQQ